MSLPLKGCGVFSGSVLSLFCAVLRSRLRFLCSRLPEGIVTLRLSSKNSAQRHSRNIQIAANRKGVSHAPRANAEQKPDTAFLATALSMTMMPTQGSATPQHPSSPGSPVIAAVGFSGQSSQHHFIQSHVGFGSFGGWRESAERQLTGEQFVEDDAHGINVGSMIDAGQAFDLLRGHVGRRAHQLMSSRQSRHRGGRPSNLAGRSRRF